MTAAPSQDALLQVDGLVVDYLTDAGPVRVVDEISFDVRPAEIFGLCGESGSGKSSLALAVTRLLPPPAVITAGRVRLGDRDLFSLNDRSLSEVRGGSIGLVPQSGMNALNPLLTIAAQIADGLAAHPSKFASAAARRTRIAEVLTLVGLAPAIAQAYPHQLSGGMRQRAALAIALAPAPKLLILDEATGGLDVIAQRQIGERLLGIAALLGVAIVLISHDLPFLAALCNRTGVLYGGRLLEIFGPGTGLSTPQHPYTQALRAAFLDPRGGSMPLPMVGAGIDLHQPPPAGCAFHPRCPLAVERCSRESPRLLPLALGHLLACHVKGNP